MLAREYCDYKKIENKPVIVSHHMLSGLLEGQEKMSKSDTNSAIFMEDTAEDVVRKVNQAFCPEGIVKGNPILDYTKNIIFAYTQQFKIERPEKYGGNLIYNSYE